MNLKDKIIPKLSKAITKYGVDVEACRKVLNDYGEQVGEGTIVCKFKGLYSESNHILNINVNDSGKNKKDKFYKLSALIYEDTELLKEGDTLIIKSEKFELVNKNDANMLGAYYDISLKRL